MAKISSSDNWGKSFLTVCRYRWLVRLLLRNSTLTWPEIASRWKDSSEVQADGELSRRTFDNMVKMLRKCGIRIYCERCSGHYKCEVEPACNIEDDNYADIMRELILGEQIRQNNSDIEAHIIGEEIPSKGSFFDIIVERLHGRQTITLRYKPFRDDKELEYTVEPYALKLFKRRWYLFASQKTEVWQNPELSNKPMGMATLALDRITYVDESKADKFNYPANYDAKKYFENYFGVITYEKDKGMIQPVDILLKVYTWANKHKYIASLPLHSSQKVVDDSHPYYWIFSYRMAPTYDFVQELLMHRDDIEVLKPESLRKDIAKALYETSKYYSNEINGLVMKNKLFTKSAFKIALECPRRLYYAYDKNEYANQDLDDEFLQSLAEGGYQVGELAKVYYGIGKDADIDDLDYDKALERTRSLFGKPEINIAEAAFRFGNLFVRADIIEKKGNIINLIEVKAKSWNPANDVFIKSDRKGTASTSKEIRPYLYDVAFQKYVVENALSEQYPDAGYKVKAFLMLADKTKAADVDGLNQMFPVKRDSEDRLGVEPDREALAKISVSENDGILTAFDVDGICDMIIESRMQEQKDGSGFMKSPALGKQVSFVDFVNEMAYLYCNRKPSAIELGAKCFKCPFHKNPDDDPDKKDGYRECWTSAAGFSGGDFDKPQLKDLTAQGFGKRREQLINQKKFFLNQLSMDDVGKTETSSEYLDFNARRQLQTALSTGREIELPDWMQSSISKGVYIDIEGLAEQMKGWKFPLHFIDFETSAVALPFYRGLRPYEQVAFQFSHHTVELQSDGCYRIRHAGQYLNVEKGKFPNFGFVRELKKQLDKDEGTIFRYSHHENTILRAIYEQLDRSDEQDRSELMQFIDKITHYKTGDATYVGDRDMVDLAEVVLKYYYHPMMKGSYSIKKVLPAVLNSSDFIKGKYSKPVYGSSEMPSCNIEPTADGCKAWIEYDETGKVVKDPYQLLPPVASYLDGMAMAYRQEDGEDTIANGGAALAAYSRLQFSDLSLQPALENALKVYCELDTMAMVFIWEYFYQSCIKR